MFKFTLTVVANANGVFIVSFKKHASANIVFTLIFIENNPCTCKDFFKCCNIY